MGRGRCHQTREEGAEEPMGSMTVLVVEDLERMRAMMAELLALEGYRVLTASSLPETEAVRAQLGLAALGLVVTNLRLTRAPEAHEGIDLIRRWHAVDPTLPFLLIKGDPPHLAGGAEYQPWSHLLPTDGHLCGPEPNAGLARGLLR
jgi:CheY-like chemotaxis protein